jgi:hypothetical protein
MVVAISEIIINGLIFDVKNWQNHLMNTNKLLEDVDDLFNTLEQLSINYLLVGGIALLSYIEGRNTQDIDFILSRQDLDNLSTIKITEENKDFIRGNFNQLQIDILLTQNKLFKTILQSFVTEREFGNRLIRCVTVEGLIILKLYALPSLYRQGKFDRASIYENDILLLLLNYQVDLTPLLKLLKKHLLESDLEEIKEIIFDIQARIKRFSQQQKRLESEQ